MKKNICISVLAILFIISTICAFVYHNKVSNMKCEKCEVCEKCETLDNTFKGMKLFYIENGRSIFMDSTLSPFEVDKTDIRYHNDTFASYEKVKSEFEKISEESNGVMYKYSGPAYDKRVYKIFECNTGNKDIYIGKSDMEYSSDFCKSEQAKTYVRTYHVLHEYDEGTGAYVYLTLTKWQSFEVSTVKVLKNLIPDINAGEDYQTNAYEFTFRKGEQEIDDSSVNTLFDTAELIKIEKTDKQAMDQEQDGIR